MKQFLCALIIFVTGVSYAAASAISSDLWIVRSSTGQLNNSELCLPLSTINARYFTDRPFRETDLIDGKALVKQWHDGMPNIVLFAHYGKIKIEDNNVAIIKQRADDQQWCLTLDQFKGKSTLPKKATLNKITLLIGD